jgi:hypothetical protein
MTALHRVVSLDGITIVVPSVHGHGIRLCRAQLRPVAGLAVSPAACCRRLREGRRQEAQFFCRFIHPIDKPYTFMAETPSGRVA